jgi:hypothetical protein
MTYKLKETIGNCTLYLGDALDIMPTPSAFQNSFDLTPISLRGDT